jgi:PadR family transcriptional regulator, regulatory protein PadR
MPRNILEAVQGTLDVLILQTLAWQPLHGYAVARWILDHSEADLRVEEGTLYPALHRLEDAGWIESEWGLSENNRRAKYYRLTAAGRAELVARRESWRRCTRAVDRVLSARPADVAGGA